MVANEEVDIGSNQFFGILIRSVSLRNLTEDVLCEKQACRAYQISRGQASGHELFEQELAPSDSLCRLAVIRVVHLSLHGLADENYIPFTNQPSTAHGQEHTSGKTKSAKAEPSS